MTGYQIENCIIYTCITAGVIGIYAVSETFNGFWLLLLLLFVNYRIK